MSKQLKVNLLFQADTTAAINNMQQLGALLNQISTKTTIGVDGGGLQQAVTSAQQLQIHLQNAVNVNTGKLDLNKLNSSLKKSGQTLQSLTSNLQAAGPTGQQAFLKVATAVASAEAPMLRVNQRLKDFGVTLANTVKWQIASTAIHGISGMLSSAVSHAEDLNKALNDIRIVTGYSTNTMANFAVEASNAAKELSTTTTEYARAALIFYQQGLTGDAVAERANTVVKLAQVTGQSMETVSSQMTAIWNNFDDGTKSLEYYADVLTKLGAATAASTDEISDGLEKFAAIADTIDLSYETAAAAVATVVDKTRQSADVVGTSFKTIFARMEGLKLGETLEDGVDLNKYSQALADVGINILNAKGELRSMDDILFELGEKWEGFGETTQIALAQTVGGVRQYNQMIALMDNWDSVVDNIELAKNATGELAEQQQIWSESYEAAAQRVKQAQHDLYEKFVNDKSIVVLNDVFAELINTISKVIDSMGGVLPLALTLIGIFSKTLFPLLQAGFQTLRNNIAVLTGSAAKEISQMQSSMQTALENTMTSGGMGEAQKQQIALTQKLLAMKQDMVSASKRMTLAQQQEAQAALESYEALSALVQGSLQHKAALEEEIRLMKEKMNTGSVKREMGEVAALDSFRREKQGSDIDIDSVIDQATNTSLGDTLKSQKELPAIDQQRLDIEKKIESAKASIIALEKDLVAVGETDVEKQKEVLDKIDAQKETIRQLQDETKTLGEHDEARVKHLLEVEKLQRSIVEASQQDVDKMVVGKASTTAFGDNKISRGEDVGTLEQGMTNDVVSTLDGTQDAATGDVQVNASLENLEKLYGLMAKYKTQINEITAIEKDFSNASKKSAKAIEEKTKAQTKAKTAADKVQKAEEKYNKLLKAEKKDSAAITKAKRELVKAQKEQKEALEDINRATKQSESAQNDYVKTLQNSKAKILEMAKAAGASEKDLQALSDDFAKLGQEGSEQAVTNITNKLKDLKVASQDTDNSLDLLAASMRESLLAAGFNPQQLDGLIQKLQEMGLITPDIANKMRMLGTAGDEVANKLTATQSRVVAFTTSIATIAGQLSMGISAIKMFMGAFDEGNSVLDTTMQLLSATAMILPLVGVGIKAVSTLKAASTVVELANNAAKEKGEKLTWKHIAAQNAEKISETALIVVKTIRAAVEKFGVVGIAIGIGLAAVAVAGIVALTAATKKDTEAKIENNEAQMEQSEKTAELTSKWAEQVEVMDELIAKYKELKGAGEAYGDVVTEIIDQIPEMKEAYNTAIESLGFSKTQIAIMQQMLKDIDEAAELARTAENPEDQAAAIERIAELQGQLDNPISEKAAKEAKAGASAAMSQTAMAIVEVGDAKMKDGKVIRHVGGADGWDKNDEEEKSVDILAKHLGEDNVTGDHGYDVSLDMADSAKFLEDYKALMAAAKEMETTLGDDLAESDTYREIKEMLDGSEEEYEKLKEMQAEADKYGVFDAKSNLESNKKFEESGKAMDITNISSLEEYQEYKKALLAEVGEDPTARATAEAWLEAQANVQEYVKAENRIEGLRDIAGDDIANAVNAMYNELSPEQQKLFLEVDLNKYQSTKAIMAEIDRLQSVADAEEIQVKMTAISTAKDSIKESGMTQEDWTKVRDSGINWGEEGIMEFNDFLNMTYESQMAYLDSLTQQSQIDLIETKKAAIDSINAALEAGGLSQEEINAMQENLDTLTSDLTMVEEQAFASATSLQELDNVKLKLQSAGVEEINYNAYAEGLMSLASAYENCTKEIENYNLALASGNEKEVAKAEAVLRSSVIIGEAAEKYDLSAESLEIQTKEIMKANGWSEEYAETAALLAVQNQRMNKGLTKLVDGWKGWKKTLSSTNKTSQDYTDTLVELSEAVGDLVGWYEDLSLTSDFVEKNMGLIEEASTGNVDAIIRLSAAVANYEVANAKLNTTIAEGLTDSGALNALMAYAQKMGEGTTAAQAFASAQAGVQAGFDLIANNLDALNNGESLQNILGGEDGMRAWVEQLNAYAAATGTTAEQMQTMLSSVGVTANVQTDYVEQDMTVPTYREEVTEVNYKKMPYTFMSGDGITRTGYTVVPEYTKATVPSKPLETKGYVGVASISMDGEGEAPGVSPPTFSGRQAPSTSAIKGSNSGGGGGGSAPSAPDTTEKREPTKKSDVSERYREVTDAIDNVTDALTRAERATDRLWGKDKLAAMRKENKILEEQRDLILAKAKEAEKYAKEDAANLRKVAKDIGVSVVINQDTGDITNIEDVEETLYSRLAAAEAEYNAKVEAYNQYVASIGNNPTQAQVDEAEKMKDAIDAYEENIIGKIEKDIEIWEDAEQQFQESVETWEEAGLEAEEILDQIMQNNYDIIMEGLEIPLSLNEEDLRLVDLKLSQIEDDMYSMAEAVALTTGKLAEYQENLLLVDETLGELNRAHAAGEITDAAYQEGLNEIKDKYYDNIEALMELDEVMQEYYSNTIDLANEELSKYTDQMEHQTAVLEHYGSLIELMGKSKDYKMMGKVLEGQVKTTRDAMNVSKQWYDTLRTNADALAAEYAAAVARGASDAELEIIKKNWDAAEAAANEAQDKMLSDAEAWAEALKAVLENDLAEFGQTLENALTGGTSFDTLTTQMERAVSLQEDYLTTTNKIYETNKLINTAQQAIDKTTNSAAKRRLKAYINETEQLQNQSKLSQYELEIQQMKYDLLLAEIALQEAQDSKSTVRLQRDAEGNFGYVYTADQDKVAEAEQKLADAQNALYNKGLEGANEYTEKYQQTIQEMYDTLTDIQQKHLNNEYETEEEYHKAMTEAKEYYYQKLQDYSSLYSVAVSTDSRVVADAWSTDFTHMMYDTDQWKHAVEKYTDQAIAAFTKWQAAVTGENGITSLIGKSVDEVGKTVQTVTDKSAELAKTTQEKVIPALDSELDSVNNLTGAYAAMRDTIKETIQYYTDMINRINNSQTNEWNSGSSDDDNTNSGNNGNIGNGNNAGNNGNNNGNDANNAGNDGNNNGGNGNDGGNGNNGTGSSYKEGTLEFTGDGASRIWTDSSGTRYAYGSEEQKAIQKAFDKAYAVNGGYTGDYWIGWTSSGGKLNADILHKKYGLSTGGYTGNWDGSYGKLAFLHQKELVLNAEDTENFLASMEVMERILKIIDLQSASAQLGGLLSSPGFNNNGSQVIEQNVHIEASFPAVQDRNEIEEAFNTLINQASQYANRK